MQGCLPANAARKLRPGDYRDTARQLKRLLRQLGAGDVVAGLRRLQAEERPLEEVAQVLEVPPGVRQNEKRATYGRIILQALPFVNAPPACQLSARVNCKG